MAIYHMAITSVKTSVVNNNMTITPVITLIKVGLTSVNIKNS